MAGLHAFGLADEARDHFRVVSEEQSEAGWEFVLEDDANRYTVTYGLDEGLPYASRIKRESLDPR